MVAHINIEASRRKRLGASCCVQRVFDRLLFTVTVTSNASRHFKSPLAMGEMPFRIKHASSVPISVVIDTGVNSNFDSFSKRDRDKNILRIYQTAL